MLHEIEEFQLLSAVQASKAMYGEPSPNLQKALTQGAVYKLAELTPLYIFDDSINVVIVTSVEHFENRGN